jgi:hypothetical protein
VTQEYVMDALLCNDVRTAASYSGRRFCKTENIKKDFGLKKRNPGGMMTVIQYNQQRKFKGIRCAKRVSSITAICGAFSHSKLVAPPDVLLPTIVPQRECAEISQTFILNTEDQRQIRISTGQTITYKYVESGSVAMSEANVACEGGEMKIRGKKHENILKLVTVSFTMTEVDVYEKRNQLRTSDGLLPRNCNLAFEGCNLEAMTLVLDLGKINMCQYVRIRTVDFEYLVGDEKNDISLISDEHKMLFELKAKIEIPTECNVQGLLTKTNFERIFIYMGSLDNGLNLIDPGEVDLELETRVTDSYLVHWAESINQESNVKWEEQLCNLASLRMTADQSVLHGNHLLRMQGELISEFVCSEVQVRTRAGYKAEGDVCLDHLPVYTPDNQLKYLSPLSRLLVNRDVVSTINCSAHYPIVYEDNNGKMITANPEVKELRIALSDHHVLNPEASNHSKVFKFSSLLYTPEEVQAYEQMLQSHAAEKSAIRKFSSYYCGTTGECAPSRGTGDFKWTRLMNPEAMVNEWLENVKEQMLMWGSIWGLCCFALTAVHFIIKIVIVCRNMGKRSLSKMAIMRFVFLPGNELVSLFPVNEERHTALYTRSGSTVNLQGTGLEMQRMTEN